MRRLTRIWSRRRLVTKVNLIVGTAIALVFAYLATTVYFGAASQVRYDSNDFPGAQRAATAFLALSPLERHIGYYNRGSANAAVGAFEPAQADLEQALELTPPRDECAVRINLSYVYEKLADQVVDQDQQKSGELYDQALQTLADAPQECRPDQSQTQQMSDEATERVEEKKNGSPQDQSGGTSQDSGDSSQNSEGSQDQTDPGQTDPGQSDPGQTDPGQTDPPQPPEDSSTEAPTPSDSGTMSEEERRLEELRQRGEDSNREQQQQGPYRGGGRTPPEQPW